MKFNLVGRNFQAWKTFDLNVGGFTVIVGASNRGKSALIRALRGVLRNQVSDAHIRKGEKSTEITLTVDNGPVATLTRVKTTSYKVNGEDYAKLSGELPDPLKALNVQAISVGGTKLDPVFASQFDSQFMMDLTPTDLNNVLGLFNNTEQLNQGKKTVNTSNTEINSQAKLLASEIQIGNTRVAKLHEIAKEFHRLKPHYDKAQMTLNFAETSKTLLNTRTIVLHNVRRYRNLAKMPPPSLHTVEGWFSEGKQLRQVQRARILVYTGRRIGDLPSMNEISEIFIKLTNLRGYTVLRRKLEIKPSEIIIKPTWGRLQRITQDISDFMLIKSGIIEKRLALETSEKVLRNTHKELHDLEKDTIICPKCGYQFTEDPNGN